MKLEICANSYHSAKNAQEAGAQRIELCSELAIGGITPNYGLLKQVTENLSIETFVLIRPRSGNFTYSKAEFEIMKTNIVLCKNLGFSGVVSGVLNKDNTIDIERTKALIELSKPMQFTFHRAFDWTPNPEQALQQLITLGADRILTSGQNNSAEKGLEILKILRDKAKNEIIILPGGGVSVENATLFKKEGFTEIHASLTTLEKVNAIPNISMHSQKQYSETHIAVSSFEKINKLLKNIK
ncbi:copper homeostasis protein CutC [Lacinutrix jangbogonensis]|uniref:copper homeostasis protein CutC n=1 Tax=Lacinutrix jangbogonensis TaxID=1469557 RepID=UPI00053E1C6C|nr:copper homeostasis protein CutC [Lacinutrix jangbogonensis]